MPTSLEQLAAMRNRIDAGSKRGNRKALAEFGKPKSKKPRKPKKHEESNMQKGCVEWFRLQYKTTSFVLFAVPNGSHLAGDKKQQIIQRGILKAEGALKGVSDLIMIIPSGTYYLEAKTATGVQSPEQKEFEQKVKANNHQYHIFRSFDEFKGLVGSIIEQWTNTQSKLKRQ